MDNRRLLFNIMVLCAIIVSPSCSHKSSDRLVGNDRDSHGCMASAGYTWSEARKDCVRVWEVGERLVNGDENVFVVFSKDSARAEVFLAGGGRVMCKKKNNAEEWNTNKQDVSVSLSEGELTVRVEGVTFTKQ